MLIRQQVASVQAAFFQHQIKTTGRRCPPPAYGATHRETVPPTGKRCHPPGNGATHWETVPPTGKRCHPPGNGATLRGTVPPTGRRCHPPGDGATHRETVPPTGIRCHPPGDGATHRHLTGLRMLLQDWWMAPDLAAYRKWWPLTCSCSLRSCLRQGRDFPATSVAVCRVTQPSFLKLLRHVVHPTRHRPPPRGITPSNILASPTEQLMLPRGEWMTPE